METDNEKSIFSHVKGAAELTVLAYVAVISAKGLIELAADSSSAIVRKFRRNRESK